MIPDQSISVLISASPIPSMPDTAVIDETVASIRAHLPSARLVLLCDGVRDDDQDLTADYDDWQIELSGRVIAGKPPWNNVYMRSFDEWTHQAGMYRWALERVETPLVLMVEADTPLTMPDVGPIPWEPICALLESDQLDSIRFNHEASILVPHQHLALDSDPIDMGGVPVTRTVQFSARPHVARTLWYRRILTDHFPESARSFVEDQMHGVVQDAWAAHGMDGWGRYRLAVYTPDGSHVRSRHLDGRDGREKAPVIL